MSIITGILNGTNLNQDYHFQGLSTEVFEDGVQKGYKNELEITTNQCDTGRAFVLATRDNISPSQTFLIPVEITATETIDTSGTGWIIIKLDDAKVNDGSANNADGSGIATIENVSSLPSKNYLILATLSSGTITDARSYMKIKDNTNGILDNIQTLINTTIGAGNWKAHVKCATTSAGTLSTDFENGDTIDGTTLTTGDRILIKDQTSADENGIYIVNSSGSPTRATDFDETTEITSAVVSVEQGTTNADTTWLCTSDDPIIGTDSINFIRFLSGDLGNFLSLTDTPSSYSGQAGKILSVNSGETAMEFVDNSTTRAIGASTITVASGASTENITHGLGTTPTWCKITVVCNDDSSNGTAISVGEKLNSTYATAYKGAVSAGSTNYEGTTSSYIIYIVYEPVNDKETINATATLTSTEIQLSFNNTHTGTKDIQVKWEVGI